ncbi:hypothetical protein AVEN_219650-1 [Araneus ventricosus]|uniref:Uncharacterized protein n=1 Tax=Araneus ventricosus TaxID=182803 RepID=A0A4Y2XB91_ARAVE|nr:hypothetical protein AVEN_219650-1 [Araneus ventricosus]
MAGPLDIQIQLGGLGWTALLSKRLLWLAGVRWGVLCIVIGHLQNEARRVLKTSRELTIKIDGGSSHAVGLVRQSMLMIRYLLKEGIGLISPKKGLTTLHRTRAPAASNDLRSPLERASQGTRRPPERVMRPCSPN